MILTPALIAAGLELAQTLVAAAVAHSKGEQLTDEQLDALQQVRKDKVVAAGDAVDAAIKRHESDQ